MTHGRSRFSRICEGWTLAELAGRTGLPVGELAGLEQGESVSQATAARIRQAVSTHRRERAAALIDRLCARISQRHVEHVLGLSQGYLSRLRTGCGTPSPLVLAALTLLANDPSRVIELTHGATPQPTRSRSRRPAP